ncbi:uncharacterized protein LOC142776901 [Rhipicephalus microplus]|uniref:uncharacterized protein LOC142776901 n=1 Tax=Rhipicephalus microplus TaxID=6941 RepID=UPI003F6C2C90
MLYNHDWVAPIIYACFALHNIALHAGDWTLDEYVVDMSPAEDDDGEPRGSHMLTLRNVLLRDGSSAALSWTFFEVHRNESPQPWPVPSCTAAAFPCAAATRRAAEAMRVVDFFHLPQHLRRIVMV